MLRLKVFLCDDASMLEPSFNNWMESRINANLVSVESVNVAPKSNSGFVMLVTYREDQLPTKKTLKKITRKGGKSQPNYRTHED